MRPPRDRLLRPLLDGWHRRASSRATWQHPGPWRSDCSYPLGNGNAIAEILRTLGREAEDRGFESIWVAEHVVLFDDYESQYPYAADGRFPGGGDTGLLEPLTALTYLAAVTDRIRLGTGICLVPQRNPVYTAKQVVDLDNLSGGRVDFGIGVGLAARRSSTRWRRRSSSGAPAPTSTSR